MSKIARAFITNTDVLKVEIKVNDRTVYRDAAPLYNEKEIRRIFKNLELKGFINLKEILKMDVGTDWF